MRSTTTTMMLPRQILAASCRLYGSPSISWLFDNLCRSSSTCVTTAINAYPGPFVKCQAPLQSRLRITSIEEYPVYSKLRVVAMESIKLALQCERDETRFLHGNGARDASHVGTHARSNDIPVRATRPARWIKSAKFVQDFKDPRHKAYFS